MVNLGVINWCSVALDYRSRKIAWKAKGREAARAIVPRPARTALKRLLGRDSDSSGSLVPFGQLWRARLRRISDEATRLKPGSYCEVRYEDLLADPTHTLRVVADALAIECSPKWLASASRLIRPGNVRKVDNREVYRELSDAVRDTLVEYGYCQLPPDGEGAAAGERASTRYLDVAS
jgi:hypothetical protein